MKINTFFKKRRCAQFTSLSNQNNDSKEQNNRVLNKNSTPIPTHENDTCAVRQLLKRLDNTSSKGL